VTECQGCGAWNERSRTVCVLCGTPLAETDEWDATAELPPLPPLPDGGLRTSMPAWLREPPSVAEGGGRRVEAGVVQATRQAEEMSGRAVEERRAPGISPPFSASRLPSPVLGPRADPRTFLSDDDFPRWLRDLAARETRPARRASPTASEAAQSAAWSEWPPAASAGDIPAPTALDGPPPATVVAARAAEERRGRAPWETVLLVILFVGVIAAALWALVSNGVFSPGL
jgi:hypothetical protein